MSHPGVRSTSVPLRYRALLLVALCLLATRALPAQDTTGAVDSGGNPSSRAARLSVLSGSVSFQPSGDSSWSQASLNYPLTTGDRLYADDGSRAELEVGSLTVRLLGVSDLTLTNLSDDFMQLGLAEGTIRISVYSLAEGDSIEIDTPNGALTIGGVGEYRVDASSADSSTLVRVDRGALDVDAPGVSRSLRSGDAVRLAGTDPVQSSDIATPRDDGFDQWSAQRDEGLAASPTAQYVDRDMPGYSDLDDAGRWDVDAQYGPVWYPTAVAPGWVPYRYGHWGWIEPWGWTWVEDEPWGYAPFHYGRWVQVGPRWAWLPGARVRRPVYAPALVVFVDGSHFYGRDRAGIGVQAWFPLGPGEPYYPWYHHDEGYGRRVNERSVTNVVNVTNVTNFTTIEYRNRAVATTAVPTTTFRGGQPIGRRVIPISPGQMVNVPVAPHPSTAPTPRSEAGGAPAPNPPGIARPVMVTMARRVPPVNGAPVNGPPAARSVAPGDAANRAARTSPPPSVTRNPRAPSPAGVSRPPMPVITRNAPAPQNLSFPTREQAMQQHPGRPLEPQQIDNLRAGRPAGPMRDQEAPHAQPAAQPAARPAPKAPAAHKPKPAERHDHGS